MPTYDDLAADMAGAAEPQKPAGAATLYTAADVNPDAEAGLLKLSKRTGIPAEALRLDTARKDAERQSKANQYDTLLKSSPATAKWLDDLGNARLAHDDTESLSKMEFGLGKLKSAGRAVGAGLTGFNEGFYGVLQAPAEMAQAAAEPLAGTLLPENPFTRMVDAIKARRQKEAEATKSLMYNPSAGPTEQGVYSGIQSLTQNLMTLPLAVMSGQPELTLYPMAAQTGGQAYGQARDKGLSIPSALTFGTSQAAVEYATEKIPVGRFLNDLAKNTGFTKMIAGQLASEIPGEQVATLLQDLNEWAVLNPEKPFKSYLDERPGAAYQTLVATIVGTGGNVAIGKAGQAVANRMGAAGKAQEDGKTISDLVAEAGKNKVRARSPETFSQFVQQTAEQTGNAPTEVYIDAKQFQAALNQEGVDQGAIIAAMPSVAQQFDEAVSTGGDLVVPIGELLTATPGTPLEQSLIPHVRTSADAMSMAEAQDAQTNQADYFAQEADRVLKEQADSTALQDKSQAVYDNVLEQLNAAGRFTPDVNKAYADLTRNFFVTLSGRTGQDINELYKQYGPTIAAQLPAMSGDALNATQKPLDQTMYRGVGEGSAQASAITWMSPDKTLADNYAAFRGGETQQLEHTPDKVFDAGRDTNEMTAKQFAARALTQAAKLGTADKETALAARDEFLKGASNAPDKITALWSSEDNAAKTSQFLKALGFDTIQLDENGVQTFGAIRKARAKGGLNQEQLKPTAPEEAQTGKPWVGDVLRGETGGSAAQAATDAGDYGKGRYFTGDRSRAEAYARGPIDTPNKAGSVVSERVTLQNPLIFKTAKEAHDYRLSVVGRDLVYKSQSQEAAALIDADLRAKGYDGVVVYDSEGNYTATPELPFEVVQLGQPQQLNQSAYTSDTQRAQARVLRKRADRSSDAAKAETLRAQADALDAQAAEAEAYAAGQPEAVGGQPQAPAMHKAPGPHNGVSIDQYQGPLEGDNLPSDAESITALKAASGNPDAQITVYRAVPQGGDIRAGDWVSPSREYADMHGEATMGAGSFDIVEKQVPASELYTDGNSVNELGYRPAQQLNQSAYTADTIEVDGVTRPATNSKGQPIAQTEEGLRNFWRWFGDSKVVDAEGKPLVVYHGTASSFEAFDPARVASATDGGIFGNGFYFAKDANLAEAYALQSSQLNGGDSNVMPVYLRIENPFLAGGGSASQGHINDIAGSRPTNMFTDEGKQWGEKLRDGLLAAGYDGVMDSGKRAAYANEFVAFSPEQIKSAVGNQGTFDPASPNILEQNTGAPRGAFNPDALTITLLKAADLTTFLHESAHYFLTVYEQIATQPNAPEGVAQDVDTLLQWMGVEPTPEQTRAEVWAGMSLDQKRKGHEQFAESFEQWLFGGKAPSMEMQSLFERFRTWMMRTYKSLQQFVATHKNAKLNPEIEQVFSRMLASEEQTKAAEQFRNMYPLFDSAEAAGMTPEQFAAYQAEGRDASAESAKDMTRRGLRDMQWFSNAKAKALKALQKEASGLRGEVRMEVRREVMSRPVYRAWQFLTAPMTKEEKAKARANRDVVDIDNDSLFTAIAKLGGIRKSEARGEWGADPKDKPQSGVFGKPVWRVDGGRSLDGMLEELAQYGYFPLDENGKADLRDFEQAFRDEMQGSAAYSLWRNYAQDERGAFVDPENQPAGRLDRGDAVVAYGASNPVFEKLNERGMLADNGGMPDMVAEAFGFSSGDELMRALADADDPKGVVEAITDQRMLERHGEIATPDALERAAEAAIHNRARAKFVATEYAALTKQLGKVSEIRKAARQYAENIVARTRVIDLKPNRYAAAEARAAKAAADAQRKSERDKVVTEKRNQMLNNATAKAMHEARDEAKSIAEYLKKFDKEGTRKNLDTEYLDQIDTLLERYDLRTGTSAKDIARRESLRTWVVRQLKNGDIPDIAETLLSPQERARYKAEVESRDADGDLVYADDEERIKLLADAIDRSETRSYKELTMDELRGLYDTVRQIEHLGRMKHTLLTAVDQATYEAARDDIASTITDNAKQSGKNTRTPNDWLGQKLAGLKQFGASHIKIATWARIMDGGKENGAVWRYLIRPANERASRETTMRAEATKALDEILRPLLAKVPMADKVGKGKFFPSIGESLNWQERFAVALNTGNEGNLQRLLDGRGWTMQQIMPVLNSLSAEEWHAVQKVWDHFESYRPQIAAKERRVTGKEPNWVEPREISVKTSDGKEVTLRGGYYPVVYDPRVNLKAQQHTAAEEAKGLMKAAYSAATTRRSFTKERAEEVKGRPLLLNTQGLYSGVNDVIHDLTWHEWVIDMNKLLRSKTIDQAIREHYGPEVKREFEKWRDDVVAGTRRLDHGIEKAAAWARQGVSASGLTFNLMSAAMQPLGLTQSIVRVGAKWVGKGIARYAAHPIETTKEANEKSEWMRNRSRTRFRELNELRNQVQGQTVAREMLSTYGYFFMMRMQQAVDVPTWWGAYEKAIAQGEKEDTAVALADQAVKDAQGGGEEVDQAGIERGGPLIKLFTVFYSFMNTAANLGYGQARTESSKAKLAVDMLLLYTVPAILGYALRNALTPGDSGDDDEELVKKLISEQLSYLMGLVAFGREFAQVGKVITGEDKGQGYSGPAGLRVIPDSVALAKQAKQGEFDDAFRKSFINLAGDLFGLPAAQANRTITGAQAIAEGKTANPAAIAFGYQEKK